MRLHETIIKESKSLGTAPSYTNKDNLWASTEKKDAPDDQDPSATEPPWRFEKIRQLKKTIAKYVKRQKQQDANMLELRNSVQLLKSRISGKEDFL